MNIELAKKVLDYIEENPGEHSQLWFVSPCGTTSCIAGHAMRLSGEYRLKRTDAGIYFTNEEDGDDLLTDSQRGQRLLGITNAQAERLFFDLQDEEYALDYLRSLINLAVADDGMILVRP